MLCEKTVWDNLNHDFQPPALPNYDLTRLESEDRALSIYNNVNGVRNICTYSSTGVTALNSVITQDKEQFTITNKEGSTLNQYSAARLTQSIPAGDYVLSAKISNGSNFNAGTQILIRVEGSSGTDIVDPKTITGNGYVSVAFSINVATELTFLFYATRSDNSKEVTMTVSEIMISDAIVYNSVGNSYQSFALSNIQLTPLIMHREVATTTTETMYSDFSVTVPPRSAVRITAYLNWSDTVPRSITISRSTDPSTYTDPNQVVARTELPAEGNYLFVQTSAIYVTENSSITLSIWARSKASGNNNLTVITEFLGYHA